MRMKNHIGKYKIVLLLAVLVVSILGISAALASPNEESSEMTVSLNPLQEKERQDIFNEKVQEWLDYCRSRPEILLCSYTAPAMKTEQFKEIENLGTEYLPYLLNYIEEKQDSAASALIFAAQKKAKVYIKDPYSTPQEWAQLWHGYIKVLPSKVKSIKEDIQRNNNVENLKAKKEELVQLGVPVIPYIMEDVKSGNADMTDVVGTLLSDDTTLPTDKDIDKWKTWANGNGKKYEKIKEMVLKVK